MKPLIGKEIAYLDPNLSDIHGTGIIENVEEMETAEGLLMVEINFPKSLSWNRRFVPFKQFKAMLEEKQIEVLSDNSSIEELKEKEKELLKMPISEGIAEIIKLKGRWQLVTLLQERVAGIYRKERSKAVMLLEQILLRETLAPEQSENLITFLFQQTRPLTEEKAEEIRKSNKVRKAEVNRVRILCAEIIMQLAKANNPKASQLAQKAIKNLRIRGSAETLRAANLAEEVLAGKNLKSQGRQQAIQLIKEWPGTAQEFYQKLRERTEQLNELFQEKEIITSTREFALLMGMTPASLYAFIKGKFRPSSKNFGKMLKKIEMPLQEFALLKEKEFCESIEKIANRFKSG